MSAEWTVSVLPAGGEAAGLGAGGGPRSTVLHATGAWLAAFASKRDLVVEVHGNGGGETACRFTVVRGRPTALPTHETWRVWRTRPGGALEAWTAGMSGLCREARSRPRVLRLNVQVFDPDPSVREAFGHRLAELGFRESPDPWGYRNTVVIDLTPTETALFGSLHSTARRHIRAVDKRPVAVRPILDPGLGLRLDALLSETLARTGGRHVPQDWSRLIAFSGAHPDLVRLVGMFSTERTGPDGLWAFAVGYNHGDHVEYSTAASTRETGGMNVPMGYALAWDLIRWGRSVGATWFDFGGVTAGKRDSGDDPLGGISDFKRYFSRNVVAIGDEWMYEPRPVLGAVARAIGALGVRVLSR